MSTQTITPNVPRALDHKGWKLHLNFDPTDANSLCLVQETLQWLKDENEIFDFKIGSGGGIKSGQPGKEATVYVGRYDNLIKVAQLLDYKIGEVLLDHDPNIIAALTSKLGTTHDHENHPTFGVDTLQDDIPVISNSLRYFARFDIWPTRDFSEYGIDGIPILDELSRRAKTEALYGNGSTLDPEEMLRTSMLKLLESYGDDFLSEDGVRWYLEMRSDKQLALREMKLDTNLDSAKAAIEIANAKAEAITSNVSFDSLYGRQTDSISYR